MNKVTVEDLKKLYLPPKDSHKGENGKLTIIGGSKLFHGASLWALKVASRIVDMVFYASIPENNELTKKLKTEIFDFICVPRDQMEQYIEESDAVLIGPGMVRIPSTSEESWRARPGRACLPPSEVTLGERTNKQEIEKLEIKKLRELRDINKLDDEGEQTYYLTKYLLEKYPNKKWVIDAGSLQMIKAEWLNENCLITPHRRELTKLFPNLSTSGESLRDTTRGVFIALLEKEVRRYGFTILLKGPTDIICSPDQCKISEGGNQGMTKGGTGDVLAGLAAALACKNNLFLAACAASFINKRAGEELAKKVGYYFNASDLAEQIPLTMKRLLL